MAQDDKNSPLCVAVLKPAASQHTHIVLRGL